MEYKKYYSSLNLRRQRLQKQVEKIKKSLKNGEKGAQINMETLRVTREEKVYNTIN